MKTGVRRSASIVVAAVLAVSMLFGVTALQTEGAYAASKGKLVKNVKVYYKNGKKWKLSYTDSYTYNDKMDPVKIAYKYADGSSAAIKLSYTYDETGKKISMDFSDWYETQKNATYDSKGRRITESSDYYSNTISYDKYDFITSVISDSDSNTEKTTFKYKYYSKGKPKSLKTKGEVRNVAQFTKKGYVTHYRSFNMAEPYYDCKYNFKNGLVKNVVVKMKGSGTAYQLKYVFTYTNQKIPMKRYKAMINCIMAGDCNGCGQYWY